MQKSDSIVKLAAALTKAQAELKSAPFNKTNPFLNNRKYADLGSHIDAAKPILAKHNLAVTQLVTSDETGRIGVETMLIHDSGEYISSIVMIPPSEEKGKSAAQVAGSIISYFRRYSLAAILGMYSDDEDDGAGSTGGNGSGQQQRPGNGKPANGSSKAAPVAPANEEWTVDSAGAVITPKGAELKSLTTQQLDQFVAAVDVNKSENKAIAPELERAYNAAKFLSESRKHPQSTAA